MTRILVQSDGSFRWSRQVRADREVTAYLAWTDVSSNGVPWLTWKRRRQLGLGSLCKVQVCLQRPKDLTNGGQRSRRRRGGAGSR